MSVSSLVICCNPNWGLHMYLCRYCTTDSLNAIKITKNDS